MRRLLVCALVTTTLAHADEITDREALGEALAKDGRYAEAIEQFKACPNHPR